MFLTKYRPNTALEGLFGSDFFPVLSKWFDEEKEGEMFRMPMTNVNETDKEYVLTMELPGVTKENVDVAIEEDHVVVTGEKTQKTESKGLLRREIRSEKFRRSFMLDPSIDRDKIAAKLEHGVLTLTLPKGKASVGRKIDIE
jgi:HSP20 family protein